MKKKPEKTKTAAKENEVIHVKFDYDEMLQAKRDILSVEMSLLKLLKRIKTYHFLRAQELSQKQVLYYELRGVNTKIRKLKTLLPKLHMPGILKEHEQHMHYKKGQRKAAPKIKKIPYSPYDTSIEAQLQEIQNRLKELQK